MFIWRERDQNTALWCCEALFGVGAVTCDVFDGVLFCAVLFTHEMSWMRSGTVLSQFLPILVDLAVHSSINFFSICL